MKEAATKPYPEMVPFADDAALELARQNREERSVEKLRLLWNERLFLGRAVSVGLVIGLAVAFLLPQRFESTTQLMPPDSQSNTGMAMIASLMGKGMGGGFGGVAGDLLGMKTSGAVFAGVLRSRTVEDRLVDRFNLQKVYGKRTREDARRRLTDKTDIAEDRKSGIITITVTDRDPGRSAAMAEAYVEELDRLVGQLSTSAAHRQRVFLEGRLQEIKQDLEEAEKQFSQFASKNTAIDIKEQGKAMVEAAAELQAQLIVAQSELEAARQIYAENNVRVKATKARISELRSQLQELGGSETAGTTGLEGKSTSLYPSIRKLPLLGVAYADLYRRTKVDETVFEALTQQYEMAKVEEAKDTPSVKVLDDAKIPEKRSFPPRLLIIFLCSCFCLAGTCLFVMARAQWDKGETANEGKMLAREVLQTVNATMPWSAPNGSRFHQFTHRCWVYFARQDLTAQERDPQKRS